MHTVFLGNGIVAMTTAFRLAKRLSLTDRMTIIGPQSRPGSATLAAAAMLNSFAEIEVGSLDCDLDLFRFELSHLAARMWPKFETDIIKTASSCLPRGCSNCEGFGEGGCADTGTYVVNNAAADDLDDENFDAIVDALRRFDEPFDFVPPRDIPNYMPMQKHRATRALVIYNEGWFNPRLMVEKLQAVVARLPQTTMIDSNLNRLVAANGAIDHVVLDNGQIVTGDKFVLATGATASDILDRSELGIGMQRVFYGVGVSIEIKSPDFPHRKCIRTPNRGLACGIYSVPYFQGPSQPNDHVLIGASNFISPVPYPFGRLASIELLTRAATEQINANFYRADLVRVNVGWRPTSQDTYPLIGKTSIPNLIIATGTKRDGIHLSPVLSEKIEAMLCDEPIDERFLQFAPERKPIRGLTRDGAIAKAVRHLVSAAYQHGYSPSTSRMHDQMVETQRKQLEELHDKVGAFDWGIPPEMLDMYRYGHTS